MKKLLVFIGITLCLLLCLFFFEVIITHNIGWKKLPVLSTNLEIVAKNSTFGEAITAAQQQLKKIHHQTNAPAVSIAVGIDNQVIWAEAIGYKDVSSQVAANTATSFRIGSTSKALTSAALGKLFQQKQIKLDDAVQKYVPYFDPDKPAITIRQLASHQSGIRNYSICLCFPIWEYFNNDEYSSVKESVDVFQYDELLFVPGTDFSYSSYNYTLLSAAIEGATGVSFVNFMKDSIFLPLKMTNTFPDFIDKNSRSKATFYDIKDNSYKKAFQVNNSNKWAGGGFLSTPTDLVKLGNALLGHSLLNEETLNVLFTPQTTSDGTVNEQNYALGWRNTSTTKILDTTKEFTVIHHGGLAVGSTSLLVLIPEYDLSIAILMNKSSYESFDLFDHVYPIANAFLSNLKTQNLKY